MPSNKLRNFFWCWLLCVCVVCVCVCGESTGPYFSRVKLSAKYPAELANVRFTWRSQATMTKRWQDDCGLNQHLWSVTLPSLNLSSETSFFILIYLGALFFRLRTFHSVLCLLILSTFCFQVFRLFTWLPPLSRPCGTQRETTYRPLILTASTTLHASLECSSWICHCGEPLLLWWTTAAMMYFCCYGQPLLLWSAPQWCTFVAIVSLCCYGQPLLLWSASVAMVNLCSSGEPVVLWWSSATEVKIYCCSEPLPLRWTFVAMVNLCR